MATFVAYYESKLAKNVGGPFLTISLSEKPDKFHSYMFTTRKMFKQSVFLPCHTFFTVNLRRSTPTTVHIKLGIYTQVISSSTSLLKANSGTFHKEFRNSVNTKFNLDFFCLYPSMYV